jgi:hypothetical protein
MKLSHHTPEMLLNEITNRLNDFSQRERIVIKFPFGRDINRLEIYCSETAPKDSGIGEIISGPKFDGIVTIQVFNDYTNKAAQKSSYSYKNELLNYLPKLIEKMYNFL